MPDFHLQTQLPTPSSKGAVNIGTKKTQAISPEDFVNLTREPILQVLFLRADLEELLDQPKSGGLRMYPCFANGIEGNDFSLLAVATTVDRDDIVSADASNKCFISAKDEKTQAQRITQSDALDMMNKFNELMLNPQSDQSKLPLFQAAQDPSKEKSYSKVFFSSARIRTLLADENTMGIRFYSAKISFQDPQKSFSTLAAVAVQDTGEDVPTTATLSALPCPPDCGGGSYTDSVLIPPIIS